MQEEGKDLGFRDRLGFSMDLGRQIQEVEAHSLQLPAARPADIHRPPEEGKDRPWGLHQSPWSSCGALPRQQQDVCGPHPGGQEGLPAMHRPSRQGCLHTEHSGSLPAAYACLKIEILQIIFENDDVKDMSS